MMYKEFDRYNEVAILTKLQLILLPGTTKT